MSLVCGIGLFFARGDTALELFWYVLGNKTRLQSLPLLWAFMVLCGL